MKSRKKPARSPREDSVAVALTWDGARWPTRSLPAAARAFLRSGSSAAKSRAALTKLLADDRLGEIRICWVPRLRGGEPALCLPFRSSTGRRLSFRAAQSQRFGDVLGVIYRRS